MKVKAKKPTRAQQTADLIARCQNATASWKVLPSPEAMAWFSGRVREDLFELHYAEKQEALAPVIGDGVIGIVKATRRFHWLGLN